jgi:hypothetical protein
MQTVYCYSEHCYTTTTQEFFKKLFFTIWLKFHQLHDNLCEPRRAGVSTEMSRVHRRTFEIVLFMRDVGSGFVEFHQDENTVVQSVYADYPLQWPQ